MEGGREEESRRKLYDSIGGFVSSAFVYLFTWKKKMEMTKSMKIQGKCVHGSVCGRMLELARYRLKWPLGPGVDQAGGERWGGFTTM